MGEGKAAQDGAAARAAALEGDSGLEMGVWGRLGPRMDPGHGFNPRMDPGHGFNPRMDPAGQQLFCRAAERRQPAPLGRDLHRARHLPLPVPELQGLGWESGWDSF